MPWFKHYKSDLDLLLPLKATIQEPTVLVSDPMLIVVSQTHVSSNGPAHVIKNEDVDLPCIHVGGKISFPSGYHIAKELDSSFLGDRCAINDKFHSRDDYNFYKKLSSTSTYGILNTQEYALGSSNALLARFYSQDYHNFYKK